MSIQIITDSASDIVSTQRTDLRVLPIHICFGDTEYLDGVNLTHQDFYNKLVESDSMPTTSQISPAEFTDVFQTVQDAGDTAVVITMSSKLSGTYQSAVIAAQDFPGTIYVVDSKNATLGQRALVEYALQLKQQGLDAPAIAETLDREKNFIRLVALVDTLEYLKRGGRISKTAAIAGTMLSVKPVLAIKDGEVVILGKARGSKQGNNLLVQSIQKSGGVDFDRPFFLGYTGLSDALLQKYIRDSAALWEDAVDHLPVSTIGGTIGTHAGPGAIAVAFFAKDRTAPY